MDAILNSLTTTAGEALTLSELFLSLAVSLIMGVLISYTYYKANENAAPRRNFVLTLFMLPIIMSTIILFVGSNIARAFSLAGTVSIIRFRSNAGDAKDIGYIFFAVAAGLTCGIGYYAYGALFVILLCLILFFAEKSQYARQAGEIKMLKITAPEDVDYKAAFGEIIDAYTQKSTLCGVKTADLGSVFVLTYRVILNKDANEKEMIDKIRCRNSNLTVSLAELPQTDF